MKHNRIRRAGLDAQWTRNYRHVLSQALGEPWIRALTTETTSSLSVRDHDDGHLNLAPQAELTSHSNHRAEHNASNRKPKLITTFTLTLKLFTNLAVIRIAGRHLLKLTYIFRLPGHSPGGARTTTSSMYNGPAPVRTLPTNYVHTFDRGALVAALRLEPWTVQISI